ncbi:MAG: hypothetical protein HN348_24785 [Proteobacteria bacterium]|nr:hypothetical protein [Pseudomonadota bacterium]
MAPDRPSLLNLVVCDGERIVATRYTSGEVPANSLYYSTGQMRVCEEGLCRMVDAGPEDQAVIVASEPLDKGDRWTEVEPNHLVLVTPELEVSTRPMEVR